MRAISTWSVGCLRHESTPKKIVCYPVVIAFNAPGMSTLERKAVALEIASVNIGWISPGRAAGARTVFETRRQPNRHDGRSD